MINYDFVVNKAKEAKIDRITILREYWQLIFLQKLYLSKKAAKIYFKGETAIRFIWKSFRFSEDLDFISTLNQKGTIAAIKNVFKELKNQASAEVSLRKERIIKDSLRFRLKFDHEFIKYPLTIRLDFNQREKPLTREENVLVPFDYPISPYPLIIHLEGEEILAEKFRALLVRNKARDIFDIWFLLTKGIKANQKYLEEKMKLHPEKDYSFSEITKKIDGFDKNALRKNLNKFLPKNYREFYKELPEKTIELLTSKFSRCSQQPISK